MTKSSDDKKAADKMNNPSICIITNNKKEFLPLLLLGDELEIDSELASLGDSVGVSALPH